MPKDEQVEGGLVLRESQLQGAFKNPGKLNDKAKAGAKPQAGSAASNEDFPREGRSNYATPIKNDLIGTSNDAQLKAALDFLHKNPAVTTGAAARH